MFKVSFKENPKFPSKKVKRFNEGRVTIVTLKGVTSLPKFFQFFSIPHEIGDWIDNLNSDTIDVGFSLLSMHITVKGKSVCSKDDTVDPILGERIAEARAKIHLYRFMLTFCKKLYNYWVEILYGNTSVFVKTFRWDIRKDNIIRAINKYQKLYENENSHLAKLLGNESDTESTSKP